MLASRESVRAAVKFLFEKKGLAWDDEATLLALIHSRTVERSRAERRARADGDVWTLQCLRRYLGTSGWRKLEPLRRRIRRTSYYDAENARRRALRDERRKIRKRTTLNPCPTRVEILEAWTHVRESHEAMVRFGSMLMDLECYLDNSLIISEEGAIVGRRGGVKRWLQENIPALYLRYTAVVRYKAAAKKLRQVVGLRDPVPAAVLVDERDYVTDEILRAREIWRQVDEGVGKSVAALIARIDSLLDSDPGGGGRSRSASSAMRTVSPMERLSGFLNNALLQLMY